MPNSYCHVAMHIIFATVGRAYSLSETRQAEMYSYIGGIIKNVRGVPIRINGTEDHLHVLCLLPRDMCIAEFVKNIKACSSKWYNEKYQTHFHWQAGYAAYSVSKSALDAVEKYIKNQKEHHQRVSFTDEYDRFLRIHGFSQDVLPPARGSDG